MRHTYKLTTPVRACLVIFGFASLASGQRTLTVKISVDSINARSLYACQYATAFPPVPADASGDAAQDRIIFQSYTDITSKKLAPSPIPLELRLDHSAVKTVATKDSNTTVLVGTAGLAERAFTVWAKDATSGQNPSRPLCNASLFQPPPSFAQSRAFETHTDVIASGEVSTALRSGSDNSAATGTLGFHHVSFPGPTEEPSRFPWFFLPKSLISSQTALSRLLRGTSFPLDGEDLRAVISVAGTVDSVTGPGRGNFAQAVLLPANGGVGGFKSVNVEYFAYKSFGQHQAIGPAFRVAASESRWAPDSIAKTRTAAAVPFSTKLAVLVALDIRLRAVLINRVSETDDNSLSFAISGGYIRRTIGGDVTARPNGPLMMAATGDSLRTDFAGWAVGTDLRLRQVTAFADFQCLSCALGPINKRQRAPNRTFFEALEGLQPIIGFRFEAPFFTVGK